MHKQANSEFDLACMARALELAECGLYTTRPNPRVGCVLAQGDRIIGAGFHAKAGLAHAEVVALQNAQANGESTQGATAYVTLEPCAHIGRTGPCAIALREAGIARVLIASGDPFAQVAGRGVEILRHAGIAVESGLMNAQARALNAGFFSRIERGRPWLRLKMAASLDGRTALANGASQWLTSEPARIDVQRWRARSCAILTGIGTVLADNPRLNARLPAAELDALPAAFPEPLKVVLDTQLRTPANARLLHTPGRTLIAHSTDSAAPEPALSFSAAGLDPDVALSALLAHLATAHQIGELLVEAGATLAGTLFRLNLVDELLLYTAPIILGERARPFACLPEFSTLSEVPRWQVWDVRQLGPDVRMILGHGLGLLGATSQVRHQVDERDLDFVVKVAKSSSHPFAG